MRKNAENYPMGRVFGIFIFCMISMGLATDARQSLASATPVPTLFKTTHSNFYLQPQEGWTDAKFMYGFPLMLMGPDHAKKTGEVQEDFKGARTAISFIPGPREKKKITLLEETFKKSYPEFIKTKQSDLAETKAKVISSFPYAQLKWKTKKGEEIVAHQLGVRFDLFGQIYDDFTYHLTCNGQFFMVKVLYLDQNYVRDQSDVTQILRSFSCDS